MQRSNPVHRRRCRTCAGILQPHPRPLSNVAEIPCELRACHHVVLAFEESRTHSTHHRIRDVLQLWIVRRRRERRALTRQSRALRLELVTCVAQRGAKRTHRPQEQDERQQHCRAEYDGATVALIHRPPPHRGAPADRPDPTVDAAGACVADAFKAGTRAEIVKWSSAVPSSCSSRRTGAEDFTSTTTLERWRAS